MKKMLVISALAAVLLTSIPAQAMCSHMGNMVRIFGAPLVKASPFIGANMWGRFNAEDQTRTESIYASYESLQLCGSALAEANFNDYDTLIRAHAFTRCRNYGYSRNEIYTKNVAHAVKKSTEGSDLYRERWSSVAKKLQTQFDQENRNKELLFLHYSV